MNQAQQKLGEQFVAAKDFLATLPNEIAEGFIAQSVQAGESVAASLSPEAKQKLEALYGQDISGYLYLSTALQTGLIAAEAIPVGKVVNAGAKAGGNVLSKAQAKIVDLLDGQKANKLGGNSPDVEVGSGGKAAPAGTMHGGSVVADTTKPFDRNAITEGFQDHHIISDKNVLTKNHELLDLSGTDLQKRQNKIFLPTDAELHPIRSIHLGRHKNSVSENLAEQMDAVVEVGKQQGFTQQQYKEALDAILAQERQILKAGDRALNKNAREWAQ